MKPHLTIAVTLLASALIHPLSAANRIWQNPVSGNFDGTGNQWGTAPPGKDDGAYFSGYGSGSEFTVTLTQDIENQRFRVYSGSNFKVTLNLNHFTYTTTHATDRSIVGDSSGDNVELTLTGGGTLDAVGLVIGNGAGSVGTLTLEGVQLSTTQESYFGNSGTATFNIQGGSVYTSNGVNRIGRNTGSSSTIKITGESSKWTSSKEFMLGGGANSTVSLEVSEGGVLETTAANTDGAVNIGQEATSTVSVLITGDGSLLDGRAINVGGSRSGAGGTATVSVTDKGLFKARTTLSLDSKGTIIVNEGRVEAKDFGSDQRRVTGTLNLTFGTGDEPLIKINGDVFLNDAKLDLGLASEAQIEAEQVIRLLEYGGTLSGTFQGFTEGQTVTVGSQSFLFSYELDGLTSGRAVGLTAIPEPGSAALSVGGFVAFIAVYGYRTMMRRGGRAE